MKAKCHKSHHINSDQYILSFFFNGLNEKVHVSVATVLLYSK